MKEWLQGEFMYSEGQFGMTYLASSTTISRFKTEYINNSMNY